MKRNSLFLLILHSTFCILHSSALRGQNLVPNPGFEDTVDCPQTLSHVNYATGWSTFRATPDFFHSCTSSAAFPSADVPDNRLGYQYARTGEGYGGFYAYQTNGFYREILGIQLSSPLVVGQQYYVRLFLSRAVNLDPAVLTGLSCNKLGVRFSTVAYSLSNAVPIDGVSQIYTDSVVTDTSGWFNLSGTFIADSAYSYLSIGNFFPDSLVTFQAHSTAFKAYYYVDDVCIATNALFCADFTKGVDEDSEETFSLYPNPADDYFTIYSPSELDGLLTIYDVTGREVYRQDIQNNKCAIRTDKFSPAMYLVKVSSGESTFVSKLLIE